MSAGKKEILPVDMCHCRVLDMPIVNSRDMINMIRYRLSSFYPGSVEDLLIDYTGEGDKVIAFYMEQSDYSAIKSQFPQSLLFSPYHLLMDLNDKNGMYYMKRKNRLEILEYSGNCLVQCHSKADTGENRNFRDFQDAHWVENQTIADNCVPLFRKKKKRDYVHQILILTALLISVPQAFLLVQIKCEELNLKNREIKLTELLEKSSERSGPEKELNRLKEEYGVLQLRKPLSLYEFISDLSEALGQDVKIESLVLKDRSFQMNGEGVKILEKMEMFQRNKKFQYVIPYEIQAISGSEKERFSLTGNYNDE